MNPLDYLLLSPQQFKAKKDRQDNLRMAGNNPNLIIDAQGFVRTSPGAFQGPSGGTDLNLDLTGGAIPPVSLTSPSEMITPGSNEQVQRLLGLQQARDERAKAQRLSEDDYKLIIGWLLGCLLGWMFGCLNVYMVGWLVTVPMRS